MSAWASSSYSWVSRLWSGDVTGDAVSYLSDYWRDAQTTCCVAVGGHPALGCVFGGVDSYPGDGQLILANAPSRRLTISFSVTLPAKAKMEPKMPPAAGIIATTVVTAHSSDGDVVVTELSLSPDVKVDVRAGMRGSVDQVAKDFGGTVSDYRLVPSVATRVLSPRSKAGVELRR